MRLGTHLRIAALKPIVLPLIAGTPNLIDLGGYDGAILKMILGFCFQTNPVLIEIDISGLKIAKKAAIPAVRASVLSLPLKSKSVETVLCLDLIEHLQEDQALFQEVVRILKNRGTLILTTPVKNGVTFPFLPRKYTEIIHKQWGHIRKGYSLRELNAALSEVGLVIKTYGRYFNYFSRFFYWFRIALNFLGGLGDIVYRTVIRLEPFVKVRTEEHIILATKR